jgi:hypothetical protein
VETRGTRTYARALVTAGALLLALGLTACGGDDGEAAADDDEETSTGADEATTTTGDEGGAPTTEPQTPGELAIAAYVASWEATARSLGPAQEVPELAQTTTGEALTEKRSLIAATARNGHRFEGGVEPHPEVLSESETEVLLSDCAVENSVEYDDGGAVVDTAENAVTSWRVTVVNERGRWKVSDFEQQEGQCNPS